MALGEQLGMVETRSYPIKMLYNRVKVRKAFAVINLNSHNNCFPLINSRTIRMKESIVPAII